MNATDQLRAFVVEAARATVAQRWTSLFAAVAIAAMCTAGMLTSGRAEATDAAVLATIDEEGTRSIVVRTGTDSGLLTTAVLEAMGDLDQVETVVGLTQPTRIDSPAAPRGKDLGYRTMVIASGNIDPTPGVLLASQQGLDSLGFAAHVGTVVDEYGIEHLVRGPTRLPTAAAPLEPLILTTRTIDQAQSQDLTYATIFIVAKTPADVDPLVHVIVGLIASQDPSDLTIETSAQLADVRAAVAGTLSEYSRRTVLGDLAGSALMVMVALSVLAIIRRRDFGRRRALGASRMFVIALMETQSMMLGAVGGTAGTAVGYVLLMMQGAALPGLSYVGAIAVLAVVSALVGALPPALFAATRDPLVELRMP